MELRIAKQEFLKGLRTAQAIADRKSTSPILANVLVRTQKPNSLLLMATDSNISCSAELTCEIVQEGSMTLAAKSLFELVASAPADQIWFKQAENCWAEMKSGKVNFRLAGLSDRDFPKLPDHRECTFSQVNAEALKLMLDRTMFSICNDETRYHLNGVYFSSDGKRAKMASTDGHRLTKVENDLEGSPELTSGITIPKKGLAELRRLLDTAGQTIDLCVKTPHLFVRASNVTLAIKLIDAQFPPYEAIIPKGNDKILILPKADITDALKRTQLMSTDTRGVRFVLSTGKLQIIGDNPDLGEIKEEIEVSYEGPGVAMGVNPKYVLDVFAQIHETSVRIDVRGELDPILLRPCEDTDDYKAVVMPMRI